MECSYKKEKRKGYWACGGKPGESRARGWPSPSVTVTVQLPTWLTYIGNVSEVMVVRCFKHSSIYGQQNMCIKLNYYNMYAA